MIWKIFEGIYWWMVPLVLIAFMVALSFYLFLGLVLGKVIETVAKKFEYGNNLADFFTNHPVLFIAVWPLIFAYCLASALFVLPLVIALALAGFVFKEEK